MKVKVSGAGSVGYLGHFLTQALLDPSIWVLHEDFPILYMADTPWEGKKLIWLKQSIPLECLHSPTQAEMDPRGEHFWELVESLMLKNDTVSKIQCNKRNTYIFASKVWATLHTCMWHIYAHTAMQTCHSWGKTCLSIQLPRHQSLLFHVLYSKCLKSMNNRAMLNPFATESYWSLWNCFCPMWDQTWWKHHYPSPT